MKLKLYSTVYLLLAASGFASADFIVIGFSSNDETIDHSIQLMGTGIMVSFIAIILLATATWITLVCFHCLEFNKKGRRQRSSAKNLAVIAVAMSFFLGSCGNPQLMTHLSVQHLPKKEHRECAMINHSLNCTVTFSEYTHFANSSSNWNARPFCKYCGPRANAMRQNQQ